MENKIEGGHDLRLLKIGIWFLSVLSGFLRLFIAAQYRQLDQIIDNGLFIGYFIIPLTFIFQLRTLWRRCPSNDIAVKFPHFYQILLHLVYLLYYCAWIYYYILHFGWQNPLVVIASAIDFTIIVLLITHLLFEEPPRYSY